MEDYDLLEEGRVALHVLERQLLHKEKDRGLDDANSESSKQASIKSSERRLLDQVPRDARLHYRKGSPLGLTIEELDDRGLLDGGGSVPNYYTSIKQRGRRSMELRKRSSRIQERGQEALAKLLNGFFHVLRTLMKRGIEIEENCKRMDTEGRGMVDKQKFSHMLKDIGIPFVPREVAEIARRYTVPSSNLLDYESLLRDAGVKGFNRAEIQSGIKDSDSEVNPKVMLTVKNLLLETSKSLGKSVDDVYRMFARWDNDGTGTVTATQFMRVLARLHVELSDQDQDFLVEILDMNSSGRVDFESLLNFCFADSVVNELGSPGASGKSFYGEDSATHGDTISTEGKNSLEYSSGSGVRRPHTASTERPTGSNSSARPESDSTNDIENLGREGKQHLTGVSKRPLTASARVYGNNPPSEKDIQLRRRLSMDERYLATSMSDDGIDDDDDELLTPREIGKVDDKNIILGQPYIVNNGQGFPDGSLTGSLNGSYHGSINDAIDLQDGASFNDNTLITADQDELYFGSPQGLPISDGFTAFSQRTHDSQQTGGHSRPWQGIQGNEQTQRGQYSYYQRPDQYEGDEIINLPLENGKVHVEYINNPIEPYEHLAFLATQTLTTVRDFIIGRHRAGKSLREIYQHFDRQSKLYFDAGDFMKATSDLRIETSEKVAGIAIAMIAIDGGDKVSFGEFKVFVNDSDHKTLTTMLQQNVAQQLERQGRKFQTWLYNIFWEEEAAVNGGRADRQATLNGLVSSTAFSSSLNKISPRLTSVDVDRLTVRFDLHGQGRCSVSRFLKMIQDSNPWRQAEKALALQEEATEEAMILRRQIQEGSVNPSNNIPEELISMAEYLGIRVISENHLLWIAADALKAPLPMSWTVQKDKQGRTFFFNHITNQSRWDHPLDPHFRKLRDKYRQSAQDIEESKRYAVPNSQISFGGIGASLNPPPMNIVLQNQTRPKVNDYAHNANNAIPQGSTITGPRVTIRDDRGKPPLQLPASDKKNYSQNESKPIWRDRNPSSSDLRQLYNAQVAGGPYNRPNSAPNYINESVRRQEGENPLGDSFESQKKHTADAIYKAPYSNKPVDRPQSSSGIKRNPMPMQAPVAQMQVQNGVTRKRAQSAGIKRPNPVERVINIGREVLGLNNNSNIYVKPENRNAQLADMFDDNIIGRLDSIIIAKNEKSQTKQGQQSKKGGIVLIGAKK